MRKTGFFRQVVESAGRLFRPSSCSIRRGLRSQRRQSASDLRGWHPPSTRQATRLATHPAAACLLLLVAGLAEASGARVAIADPALAAAVERALDGAAACRPAVGRAFSAKLHGDETWLAGDLAACKASGATSYIRRSVPGTAYACPSLADASAAERAVYVLHEELHLAGVTDSHGPDGKDPAQRMNAAIIRACWQ